MIRPKDTTMTLMAGLYRLEEHDGMKMPHFSILTREPGEDIRFIHDRMPVILDAQDAAKWISPETSPDQIKTITVRALTGMVFEQAE